MRDSQNDNKIHFIKKSPGIHALQLVFFLLNLKPEVPVVARQKWIRLASMRMWVWSLASLSGSDIWHCCELWCRSQTWLGSGVAVAVAQASSCSSDLTPSLGNSMCHGCGPKKQKKKKTKKNLETQHQTTFVRREISLQRGKPQLTCSNTCIWKKRSTHLSCGLSASIISTGLFPLLSAGKGRLQNQKITHFAPFVGQPRRYGLTFGLKSSEQSEPES